MPTVTCCYADAGKTLPELLEESFQLYLIRALASADAAPQQNAPSRRNRSPSQ